MTYFPQITTEEMQELIETRVLVRMAYFWYEEEGSERDIAQFNASVLLAIRGELAEINFCHPSRTRNITTKITHADEVDVRLADLLEDWSNQHFYEKYWSINQQVFYYFQARPHQRWQEADKLRTMDEISFLSGVIFHHRLGVRDERTEVFATASSRLYSLRNDLNRQVRDNIAKISNAASALDQTVNDAMKELIL